MCLKLQTCQNKPSTSSFSTFNRDSLMSSPVSSSSFVLSRSLRAVTTTGALVVCKTRFARANPMPRDAGEIKDHGSILEMMNRP
jgi:hypothetical protein